MMMMMTPTQRPEEETPEFLSFYRFIFGPEKSDTKLRINWKHFNTSSLLIVDM